MLRWLAAQDAAGLRAHIHLNRGLVSVPAALLLRARDIPYILQTHGMCQPWSDVRRVIDATLIKGLLESAARVLVLSQDEANDLRRLAPRARYAVAINAVSSEEPGVAFSGPVTPRVLFCARLHPRKGLDVFIEAAAQLQRRTPDLLVTVAGADEGAERSARIQASALGVHVEWLGSLDAAGVRRIMRTSSVLMHPAPREPFGMSMLEAMALSLPVVAAESTILAPLFESYNACLLAEDRQVTSWANAVDSLLLNPGLRAQLIVNGLRMIQREFSVDRLVEDLQAAWL